MPIPGALEKRCGSGEAKHSDNELGHAGMAIQCGVRRWLRQAHHLGRTTAGEHFGRAFWAIPQNDLLVLSGGVWARAVKEGIFTYASYWQTADFIRIVMPSVSARKCSAAGTVTY
jgi:hypothetical protein